MNEENKKYYCECPNQECGIAWEIAIPGSICPNCGSRLQPQDIDPM